MVIQTCSDRSEGEVEESVAGEEAAPVLDEEFEDVPDPPAAVLRVAFPMMDEVDPCNQFQQRAAVMKNVPKFLQGLFKKALKVALRHIVDCVGEVDQERGWKLLLMLPRMLLHRPPRWRQSVQIKAQGEGSSRFLEVIGPV